MHRTLIAVVVVFAAFGVFGASTARGAETREISGTVYIDSNLNGVRDAGEKGAGGRTVEVEDSQAGTLQATTASDGRYHFENVPVDGGNMIHVLTDEKAPCADTSWRPLSPEDDWSNINFAAVAGEGCAPGFLYRVRVDGTGEQELADLRVGSLFGFAP